MRARPFDDALALSDEALLASCAAGDNVALATLFDRFHEPVYRFAGRLSPRDRSACDDIVQSTFVEVWRIAGTFRGGSQVLTWILGVAANLARQTLRSERRRRVRQAAYLERSVAIPDKVEAQVDQRRLIARVESAFAALPDHAKAVFLLCDVERLPAKKVATLLDVPEGTVGRRLHEARKAIRVAIQTYDAELRS